MSILTKTAMALTAVALAAGAAQADTPRAQGYTGGITICPWPVDNNLGLCLPPTLGSRTAEVTGRPSSQPGGCIINMNGRCKHRPNALPQGPVARR